VQRLTCSGGSVQYRLQVQLKDVFDDPGSNDSSIYRSRTALSVVGAPTIVPRFLLNPSRDWSHLPWINVARLSIGHPLPVSSTSFDIGRLPTGTLQFLDPFDAEDFCSTPVLESYLAKVAAQPQPGSLDGSAVDGDSTPGAGSAGSVVSTDYLVHVVTGDCTNAGTPNNILISIVGKFKNVSALLNCCITVYASK